MSTGDVMCWGKNDKGQLGNGTMGGSSSTPTLVVGLDAPATAITAGGDFTCALLSTTNVQCWGNNTHGEMGNGTTSGASAPGWDVGVPTGAISLDAGDEHACVVTPDADIWCWGRNDKGQLGHGPGLDSLTPVPVSGVTTYAQVSAAEKHTCAITTAGGVKCWGLNDKGQLGRNNHLNSSFPVSVVSLPGQVTNIGIGGRHSCAAISGRGPVCWGLNDHGQLGHVAGGDDPAPVDVSSLGEIDIIVGGGKFTCAMTSIEVWCWGQNDKGQLGDGTNTDSDVPVTVMPPEPVIAIAAGDRHACYMEDSFDVYCWGENNKGQLGDGTTTDSNVPVEVLGFP